MENMMLTKDMVIEMATLIHQKHWSISDDMEVLVSELYSFQKNSFCYEVVAYYDLINKYIVLWFMPKNFQFTSTIELPDDGTVGVDFYGNNVAVTIIL